MSKETKSTSKETRLIIASNLTSAQAALVAARWGADSLERVKSDNDPKILVETWFYQWVKVLSTD